MTDDEINELGRVFTGLGQGTPEWDRIRIGKATASRIGDVCARRHL